MFQDIKVSDDLNTEFLEYLKSESSSNQTMTHLIGLDFNIYVLQVKPQTKVFFCCLFQIYHLGQFMASCSALNKYIYSSPYP